MEEKVVELIADGQAHEYLVACSRGMNNENVSIQAGVMGTTVLLSGDIKIEQRLKKGDRVWHSVALTQMSRPAGTDFTKDGVCFTPYSSLLLQKTGCQPGHRCILIRFILENKNMGCYGKMSIVCGKK